MYALIDNSTLTAVQRLMGEIPVKNKNTMDVVYSLKGGKEFVQARDILKELDAIQSEKGNTKYVTDANLLIAEFYDIKTESIDFLNRKSNWKIPL